MREDERALDALRLLADGEVELKGRMPWSSNATFLVEVADDTGTALGVYKPHRGERPLWDFPDGLYRREAAAWVLSDALGWGIVPPTVVRDGPLGVGSVQLFVDADFDQHYYTLFEDEAHHDALRTICAFDLVANNTDRKGGHCLLGPGGRVFAIDNGLCFHPDPKIRTVIWEFATEPVPARLLDDLAVLVAQPPSALSDHLTPTEVRATLRRAAHLVADGHFPLADPDERCYPWPLV